MVCTRLPQADTDSACESAESGGGTAAWPYPPAEGQGLAQAEPQEAREGLGQDLPAHSIHLPPPDAVVLLGVGGLAGP